MNDHDKAAEAFREFVAILKTLRTPGTGCPWDLEQDHRSLRPYLVEETFEVLDAIDRGRDADLREELGDLLLQIVLHAQIAADREAFTIEDVVRGIADKMIRRHPHVFGTTKVSGSAEVLRNWDAIKAVEKSGQPREVPLALPALARAQRVAGKLPLPSEAEIMDRVREGMAALRSNAETRERELGELLFTLCQWARRMNVSAEDALRQTLVGR